MSDTESVTDIPSVFSSHYVEDDDAEETCVLRRTRARAIAETYNGDEADDVKTMSFYPSGSNVALGVKPSGSGTPAASEWSKLASLTGISVNEHDSLPSRNYWEHRQQRYRAQSPEYYQLDDGRTLQLAFELSRPHRTDDDDNAEGSESSGMRDHVSSTNTDQIWAGVMHTRRGQASGPASVVNPVAVTSTPSDDEADPEWNRDMLEKQLIKEAKKPYIPARKTPTDGIFWGKNLYYYTRDPNSAPGSWDSPEPVQLPREILPKQVRYIPRHLDSRMSYYQLERGLRTAVHVIGYTGGVCALTWPEIESDRRVYEQYFSHDLSYEPYSYPVKQDRTRLEYRDVGGLQFAWDHFAGEVVMVKKESLSSTYARGVIIKCHLKKGLLDVNLPEDGNVQIRVSAEHARVPSFELRTNTKWRRFYVCMLDLRGVTMKTLPKCAVSIAQRVQNQRISQDSDMANLQAQAILATASVNHPVPAYAMCTSYVGRQCVGELEL